MVGRPTSYDPKYCEEIIEYFSRKPDENIAKVGEKQRLIVMPPMFVRFAQKIGVHDDTLTEWRKVHPEFSAAYSKCKALQKAFIQEAFLSGIYSGAAAIFAAKNMTDMRDEQHLDVKSDGKELKGGLDAGTLAIIREFEEKLRKDKTS